MANPGGFRIEVDAAKSGGISDPRNGTMLKMFNLIDIGERAGSGIPNIFRVWREQGWKEPVIVEFSEPDRTVLSLSFSKNGDKKAAIKSDDKKAAIKSVRKKTRSSHTLRIIFRPKVRISQSSSALKAPEPRNSFLNWLQMK